MEPEEIKGKVERFQAAGVDKETITGWFKSKNIGGWESYYDPNYGQSGKANAASAGSGASAATTGSTSNNRGGSFLSAYKPQQTQITDPTEGGLYTEEEVQAKRADKFQSGSRLQTMEAAGDLAYNLNTLQTTLGDMQAMFERGAQARAEGKSFEDAFPNLTTDYVSGLTEEQKAQNALSSSATFRQEKPFQDYMLGSYQALESLNVKVSALVDEKEQDRGFKENMARAGFDGSMSLQQALNQYTPSIVSYTNEANSAFAGAGANEIVTVDENGVSINADAYNNLAVTMDAFQKEQDERLAQERKTLEGHGDLWQFGYDMMTGVRNISMDLEGMYTEIVGTDSEMESLQYEQYLQGFRRTASLQLDGLSNEEIKKGVVENILEGNFDAGFSILTTDLAQTMPQLAAQAAITYGTGGFGSLALRGAAGTVARFGMTGTARSLATSTFARNMSYWAGAGFMGSTTAGNTLISTYGTMEDSQRYQMAVGNAVVETLSERLFVGDIKAVLGTELRGLTRREIRQRVFGTGLFSSEMRALSADLAKQSGKQFLKNAGEEGLEEFVAGLGSAWIEGFVTGKPMQINYAELADQFLIGAAAGGAAGSVGAAKRGNFLKASFASVGVLSSNYVNIRAERVAAQEAVRNARDEAEASRLQGRAQALAAVEAQTRGEEIAILENMTDEQLGTATTLYHRIRNAAFVANNEKATEEEKQAAILDGKKANAELKALKEQTAPAGLVAEREREAVANFDFGTEGTIEVSDKTDAQGSSFVAELSKIATALGGNKVLLHKDYDAAAASTGKNKEDLLGSRGFYKADDGSIHIVLPAAQSNTAFHEAYHAIARNIDPKYLKNWLAASIPALMELPTELQNKYAAYFKKYGNDKSEQGKRLLAEEIWAEMRADIATGKITVENSGSALSHGIAGAMNAALRGLGLKINKYQSFKDFSNFMDATTESLKKGTQVGRFQEERFDAPTTNRDVLSQMEKSGVDGSIDPQTFSFTINSQNAQQATQEPNKPADPAAVTETASTAVRQAAKGLSEGSSINLTNEGPANPVDGYMVGDGRNEIQISKFEITEMTPQQLSERISSIVEQYQGDGFAEMEGKPHLGVFVEDDMVTIDRSHQVASVERGMDIAITNSERSIYDVANDKVIETQDVKSDNLMFQIDPAAIPAGETIKLKKGKYGSSVMRSGIPMKNFQQVVADFRAQYGKDPVVALWMGDQSGYGVYTLTDGSTTNLEGGLGHLINKDNMAKGVAWATNKSDGGVQGVLQNADIVAEVSGHPVKSSRFYKKTTEVMAREFAIAWKKSAGKTIKHGKYEVVVPKMPKGSNEVDAIKSYMTLVIEAYRNDGKAAPAQFENILTQGKKVGTVQYINLSEIENLEDLVNNERRTSLIANVLGSFEATKSTQEALAALGMPTEEQITDQLRDGYLLENEFQEGDIYGYYMPKRENGRVVTQPGNHSTYQTDIMGEMVAVASERQNVFDMVPAFYHLRELKTTGRARIKAAQEQGLTDAGGKITKDGKIARRIELTIVEPDVNVDELSDKEAESIVKRIARAAKAKFESGELTRDQYEFFYSGKSGRVSTDVAADLQRMRVMNSQATIVQANAMLATMAAGMTWEQKVDAMNKQVARFKDAGYKAADISTFLDEFYGDLRDEMGDVGKAGYPQYGHSQTGEGLLFQSGLYVDIANMLAGGKTEAQVRAQLIADGFSVNDAKLLVAKAKGYKIGMNAGRRAGHKSAMEIHTERMKAQREKEKDSTKAFRNEAKGRLLNMNQINDELVNALVEMVEKYGNVKLTSAQLKSILRGISATQKKIYKKGMADDGKFALTVVALVDRLANIIEKQHTAKQIAEQNDLLRKVRAKQKALKNQLAKLPKTSRSPLISYFDEVNELTSVEAGHLSMSSLKALDGGLDALKETTKQVSATTNKSGQVVIRNPYVLINGKQIDFRRAKVYFNELVAPLTIEANAYEQALIAADIQNYMDATGADFASASAAIMQAKAEKNMKQYEKALKQIADDLGLDITNVQELEMALEAMAEERNEQQDARRREVISQVITPTAVIWRNWLAAEPDFADIFGLGAPTSSTKVSTSPWMFLGWQGGLSADDLAQHIEARMERLSFGQLRRVEFAMFDYIVNGRALGTRALGAEVMARNEGRDEMAALNMTASDTREKKGGAIRNWIFSNLETTPTFFRRIFLLNSETQVAKYMNALGFSSLRSNAAKADVRHATVMGSINEMLQGYKLNNAYSETALQIYAMVMQKPAGMAPAEWALALRKQFEMAAEKDNRYNEKVMEQKKKAINDFFFGPTGALQLEQIQAKLEAVDNLTAAWSFIGNSFQVREHLLADYAEAFLGQRFVSEENYIPFSFRRGGDIETLQNQVDNAKTIRTMLDSYSQSKMGKRASATFERNPDAIKTSGRYIDLNFFGTIDRTHKENEVKIATSVDVSYISEMTSERNDAFTKSVPSEAVRSDIRQKVYDHLIDQRKTFGDEALSPTAKKWITQGRSAMVLYYFGAVVDQIAKQSAPMWNTLAETKNFDSKMEFLGSLVGQFNSEIRGVLSGDMDAKQQLSNSFDIGNRNVRDAVISFTGDRPATGDKTSFEKGVDLSTKSLVVTDKIVAGASWFAYYKDWHYQNGMKPSEWSWQEAAKSPNSEAAEYASLMVSKDQNISTGRDASKFNRSTGGISIGLVKSFMIPFVDFLMNKKMNMMIDAQKLAFGSAKIKGDAIRSTAGTVAEIAHFQTMAWMVLSPLYAGLGAMVASIFGVDDDEDDSWFSEKFNLDMWKRGMITDLNPYVMPFKLMEDGWIGMWNMANYYTSDEREALVAQTGDERKAYDIWLKVQGIPSFGGVRDDADAMQKVLSYTGPAGSIVSNYTYGMSNIATLQEDVPYYVTSSGTKKFLTEDEANRMTAIEAFKVTYLTFGFATGLMFKEVNSAVKSAERGLTKRAVTNEDVGLDRVMAERLMNKLEGQELTMDLFYEAIVEEIKINPLGAEAFGSARIKGMEKFFAENILKSNANLGPALKSHIATIRDVDRRFKGNVEVAFALHQVRETLGQKEGEDFAMAALLYYGAHGKSEIQNAIQQQILFYGVNNSILGEIAPESEEAQYDDNHNYIDPSLK